MSKSILQDKKNHTCYLCMLLNQDYSTKSYLEEHHVMDGNPNRRHSEHYGLKVYLCVGHHRIGPEAVHNNQENMRTLQKTAQEEFERLYGHIKWMEVFGRSFL